MIREVANELKKYTVGKKNSQKTEISVLVLNRLIFALEEQEPKISHWIDDKCSVCGKGIEDLIDSREWYRNEEPNFCPFCGLKLVNSQESEDKE